MSIGKGRFYNASTLRRVRAPSARADLCAASVPAVLILPRVGWLWACGASILSAVLLGLCTRRPPCPSRAADGARLVWTLLVLGAAARRLCAAFPQRESILIGLLLLLLAVYASARGEPVLTRAGTVCCLLLLALYAVLLLFSLPTLHRAWLRPQLKTDWTLLPCALLPLAALPLRPNAPRAVQRCLLSRASCILCGKTGRRCGRRTGRRITVCCGSAGAFC